MRLQISHEITFRFETPAHYAVQSLKLMPRGSSQQFVNDWRIDVSADCRMSPVEDPFGNWTHTFSIDGPINELVITASGEVMTEETNGIIRGTPERVPMSVFLRRTPSTTADAELRDKALALRAAAHGNDLSTLHALMGWIAETIAAEPTASGPALSLEATLPATKGLPRDRSHLFIAAARELDIPARFVSGYVFNPERPELMAEAHAWAEAYVGGQLGWIGFDPTLDLCPTEAHVRVATGLDCLDATPIRATSMGGGGETVTTKLTVREAKVRSRRQAMAE